MTSWLSIPALAEVADLVGERDLERVKRVVRVLDHLGGRGSTVRTSGASSVVVELGERMPALRRRARR